LRVLSHQSVCWPVYLTPPVRSWSVPRGWTRWRVPWLTQGHVDSTRQHAVREADEIWQTLPRITRVDVERLSHLCLLRSARACGLGLILIVLTRRRDCSRDAMRSRSRHDAAAALLEPPQPHRRHSPAAEAYCEHRSNSRRGGGSARHPLAAPICREGLSSSSAGSGPPYAVGRRQLASGHSSHTGVGGTRCWIVFFCQCVYTPSP
jgi:hypothetical protein